MEGGKKWLKGLLPSSVKSSDRWQFWERRGFFFGGGGCRAGIRKCKTKWRAPPLALEEAEAEKVLKYNVYFQTEFALRSK